MQHTITGLSPIKGFTTTAPTTTNTASIKMPITVVEESHTATGWYRKYSDGWIEQGGYITISSLSNYGSTTLTFTTPFTEAPLFVHCNYGISTISGQYGGMIGVQNITTTGCTIRCGYQGSNTNGAYWEAKGL